MVCLCGLYLAALLLCWHHSRRPVCSRVVTCMQCMCLPASPQLLGVSLVMCGVGVAAWPQGGGSPLDGEQRQPRALLKPCQTAVPCRCHQRSQLKHALAACSVAVHRACLPAGISPFYAGIFVISMVFPALDTIFKERVFRSASQSGSG